VGIETGLFLALMVGWKIPGMRIRVPGFFVRLFLLKKVKLP
jgi:hypothetical protein